MSENTIENTEQEENFEALLEKSQSPTERLRPGQRVKTEVVSVSGDLVYIDLGGKTEGIIDLNEFVGEDGSAHVQVGDEIEAYFVSVQDGIRRLTTRVNGYSAATLNGLRSAHEAGIPVKGEVKREVKGGFEVLVGGVRCFCPFSQIDLKGGREGGIYLGQTFSFKILEYENDGRNVILSRRILLDEERKAKIAKLKETLSVGAEITAPVSSVQNFGAFVDLGGIEGLIPASEISWDRADNPSKVLSAGETVTVKIIALDWEKNRLTLSLKAMKPDPWAGVADKYAIGAKISGTIVRLAPFGVFVNVEPGIDGLVHISNLGAGRRINHPKEVVETGQTVEAYVLNVDGANRKLSLSLQPKPEPKKAVPLPAVGEVFEGIVDKVMPFGIFVKVGEGLSGLVPNPETGTPAGTDLKRMFPSGSAMQVVVTEVDQASRKIRLSRKALIEKAAREEFEEYTESASVPASETSGGLGSIGDLLKAKMEEKKALTE